MPARKEAMPRVALGSLALPLLEGLVAFTVCTDEGNPEEACPLDVTIDPRGITLRWTGEKAAQWTGTWTELRYLIDSWSLVESERKEASEELECAKELHREADNELARARGDAEILPMRTQ